MTAPATVSKSDVIRVLVVDDSAVVRGVVAGQLNADPEMRVAAVAANGQMALMQLRTTAIDVVVLDIEMPVMDGLTALPQILAEFPGIKVVMASTLTRRNAEISLRALTLGASDYVAKPESGLAAAEEFKRDLTAKVRALGRARLGIAAPRAGAPIARAPWRRRIRPSIVAIGSSTGGPAALVKVFEAARGGIEQPIVIAQHMPATFTAMLAEQLERVSGRPCAEGKDGERIMPGRVYIAPGGRHMVVEGGANDATIRLTDDAPVNFCRPAVDPLLNSVARCYGDKALAVILTGMGADGAAGCQSVVDAGGRFIVQDEASSVVWGMPGAAARTGMAEEILPIDEIGAWLRRATGTLA